MSMLTDRHGHPLGMPEPHTSNEPKEEDEKEEDLNL